MNKFIQGILRIGLALYAMYGIYISYEFSNMFVDLPKQIGRIIGTIVLIYLALIFCGNHLAQGIQALKKKECKKIGYLTIPGIISGLFQLIILKLQVGQPL